MSTKCLNTKRKGKTPFLNTTRKDRRVPSLKGSSRIYSVMNTKRYLKKCLDREEIKAAVQ